MRSFAPRKHPTPGLQPGLHRKTSFCFSTSICVRHLKKPRQPARSFPALAGQHLSGRILYRAPHFPVVPTYLPTPAGQQPFGAYLFIPAQITSRQLATSFRLDWPVYFRSHSFYFFFSSILLYTKKETGKTDFHLFFLQSQI